MAQADLSRIDIHAHFVPPSYREACLKNGHEHPDGIPAIPAWSEETHLELMKQANITKSIVSITSPGVHLVPGDDVLARHVARECNEFAADLKRRRPEQFGFWASLPLPDVEGSLAEIAHALDELDADGVVIMTNSHGKYPGDEVLRPIFEELNRRNATVFIHPTTPCAGIGTTEHDANPLPRYPSPLIEFFFETARAVTDLFLSGTLKALPGLTFVIPHAGGGLPPVIDRIAHLAPLVGFPDITPEGVRLTLNNQFYFDMAGLSFPDQIYGLLRYVGASRIAFGSDYPFTPGPGVLRAGDAMNKGLRDAFPDEKDQEGVLRGNAIRLLAKAGK